MKDSILLVDDKEDMLTLLKRVIIQKMDVEVQTARNGHDAVRLIRDGYFDLVVADIRMPEMDGITLLRTIREMKRDIAVILLTAFGTVETAVEALKLGAYDFLTKPVDNERFVHTLRNALALRRVTKEKNRLEERLRQSRPVQDLVGNSEAILTLVDTIRIISTTDETVLITGETGTGKELAARTIHKLSRRVEGPFVAVNCPAIPESILESELFGYKKGAFTSASSDKKGLFESAEEGTLFLDEIGDIPLSVQTKLLRVLQEKEFKPLGDTESIRVNVRVIASTNQNLEKKIEKGLFRDDLFYRLNVITVRMPSLNERADDIPLLAEHFLRAYGPEYGKEMAEFADDAAGYLMSRSWKGNVRELQNVIKRAVIFSRNAMIDRAILEKTSVMHPGVDGMMDDMGALDYGAARRKALEHFNVGYLRNILQRTGGNVTHAARLAGVERQSLQHLLKKYGIESRQYKDAGKAEKKETGAQRD